MNLPFLLLPPIQSLAALHAQSSTGRRRALAGVPLVALALASLVLVGAADPAARTYYSITAGILLLGLGITLGVTAREWIRTGAVARLGLGAMAAVAGLGAAAAVPLLRRGGLPQSLAASLGLGLALATLLLLGRLLQPGRFFRWVDHALFRAGPEGGTIQPLDSTGTRLLGGHLVCTALALVAPHLVVLLPAVAATAILGVMLERRLGRLRGLPWSVMSGLVALAAASVLLIQVARGSTLSLNQLHEAPFSPAFETLVSLLLAGAAWPLLSLWPFHASPRGPATGIAGATLLFRLAAPALPGGLAHWQPALYLLVAIAAWYGAGTRRDELMLTALGGLGLLALRPASGWAGLLLVALAAVPRPPIRFPDSWRSPIIWAGIVAGVAMLLPVMVGGLETQAFYSVLTAAAATVAGLGDAAVGTSSGSGEARAPASAR